MIAVRDTVPEWCLINLVEKEASSFKKQTVSLQLETKKACKTIEKDIDDLKKKFKDADEKRAVFDLKVKAKAIRKRSAH